MKKLSIKRLLEESINEWEDENEGPQPGDADYHYQEPKPLKGIGNFKSIDWETLHQGLLMNDEYKKTGKVEKSPNYYPWGKNDLAGSDGMMSKEEYDLLVNRDVISSDYEPVVGNEDYRDFNLFYKAAQDAWEKGFDTSGYNDNSSEIPYLRGREDVQEQELDYPLEDELTDSGDGTSDSMVLSKLEKNSDISYKKESERVQKNFSNIEEAKNFITKMDSNSTEPYNFVFSIEDPNSNYSFIFELNMKFKGNSKYPYYFLKTWSYHTEYDGSDNEYTFFGPDMSSGSGNIYDVFDTIKNVIETSTMKMGVSETKTPEEKEQIRKDNREKFTDRMMKSSVIMQENENDDESVYENIVFLQGSEADEALRMLEFDGPDVALEHLKQWHYPGEHDTNKGLGAGTSDKKYREGNYVMVYNLPLGYIGLSHKLESEELDEIEGENNVIDNKIMDDIYYLFGKYFSSPDEIEIMGGDKYGAGREMVRNIGMPEYNTTDKTMDIPIDFTYNEMDERRTIFKIPYFVWKKIQEKQWKGITKGTFTQSETIEEKAESQAQQKFFGVVRAIQKGDMKSSEATPGAKKAAKEVTPKDVEDFAKTKHAGLPLTKEDAFNEETFFDKNKPSKTLRDLIDTIEAWYEEHNPESLDNVEKRLDKILHDKEDSNDEKIQHIKTRYKKALSGKPVLEEDESLDIQDEPDHENDCIISSNGWTFTVTCAGKHLLTDENMDVALNTVNNWKKKHNWFPTTWFISDHGNFWPIDENGNEIK